MPCSSMKAADLEKQAVHDVPRRSRRCRLEEDAELRGAENNEVPEAEDSRLADLAPWRPDVLADQQ